MSGFVLADTYIAFREQREGLGGHDPPEALTYARLGRALLTTMAMMGGGFEDELIERIRTGDVAADRPADLQL